MPKKPKEIPNIVCDYGRYIEILQHNSNVVPDDITEMNSETSDSQYCMSHFVLDVRKKEGSILPSFFCSCL